MTNKIFGFLKGYSSSPTIINRLFVTAFVHINKLEVVKNRLVTSYLIDIEDSQESLYLQKFCDIIFQESKKLTVEDLIELFEFVISPADKEVNGAVYTPKYIREYIVNESILRSLENGNNLNDIKFGDIACGCGGFFVTITEFIKSQTNKSYYSIYSENLFGLDIKEYSIERTKILLTLLAIANGEDLLDFDFNLFLGNALSFEWNTVKEISEKGGFDVIIGNPPYVGSTKIDDESKKLLKNWSVSKSGKADLYIPFFQIGIQNLNNFGILGYITVNTFYKSLNGRALRNYFSQNNYNLSIIDFKGEQVFKRRSTYTCICLVENAFCRSIKYVSTLSHNLNKIKKDDFLEIEYSSLSNFEGWHLNKKETNRIISKISSTGKPLGNKFIIRNGFATLKNNIYLFKPVSETDDLFFFEKDNRVYSIEKKICRNAIKPNTLKSEAQLSAKIEKLIFPYRIEEESSLFEKKKNLKILEEDDLKNNFPYAYKYLMSQKLILDRRDKGEGDYEKWYAYGRNQALTQQGHKLLFPYISDSPCFVFSEDIDLFFYNGYSVISSSSEELKILQKILMSKIFWFYIKSTSKPYSSNYYSLAKNYVKNFGICDLTDEEKQSMINMNDRDKIDEFLYRKYGIKEIEID